MTETDRENKGERQTDRQRKRRGNTDRQRDRDKEENARQ